MKTELRDRKNALAVNLGLAANVVLAALKTAIGIVGHSPALLADGINSTSDVAYYIVVAVFMRQARKPADDQHPYGHTQMESIAAVVVGAFVLTTAIAVFWESVNEAYEIWSSTRESSGAAAMALWVALATIGIKIGLTAFTRRTGKQTGNVAILALAYDHRNDILSASCAAVGIFLGRMNLPWVDPLAGALVALVILRTGIGILRQSSDELMDAVPSRLLADQITGVLAKIPGVKQVEEIHAHRFGPYFVVNVTIGVEGSQSIAVGDAIASKVEAALYDGIELIRRVHVHYHPASAARPGGTDGGANPNVLADVREGGEPGAGSPL